MARFIEGVDRRQAMLLPETLDDYVGEDNSVRAVDAFVEGLDLTDVGFDVVPEATGRPGYHPATMLRICIYGYLNQVQSSRRLERECGRNLESKMTHSRTRVRLEFNDCNFCIWIKLPNRRLVDWTSVTTYPDHGALSLLRT